MNKIIAIILFVSLVKGDEVDQCETKLKDLDDRRPIDFNEVCGSALKPCLLKCCVRGEALLYQDGYWCLPLAEIEKKNRFDFKNETLKKYSDLKLYKDDGGLSSSNIFDSFNLVYGKGLMENDCATPSDSRHVNLSESGVATIDYNSDNEEAVAIFKAPNFCVDLLVVNSKKKGVVHYYYYFYKIVKSDKRKTVFYIYGYVICSVFLVLTLLVHWLLKPLRKTLYSWLLMAYVASLTVLQIFNAGNLHYSLAKEENGEDPDQPEISEVVLPIHYFLTLSMYFWLNTLSIELWWTFRSIVVVRHKSSLSVRRKFLWFTLYACGSPAVVTLAALAADRWDAVDKSYKPHFDSNQRDERRANYFFYPTLVLVGCNCVLFLMTIYDIWLSSIRKQGRDSGGAVRKENNEKLKVFIKLFLIMGVGWLLELVPQKIADEMPLWATVLFNLYYCAFGLIIFIIFVCKRKVIGLLFTRCNIHNKFTERFTMKASTRTGVSKNGKSYSGAAGTKSTDDSELRATTIRSDISEPHDTTAHTRSEPSEPHATAAHACSEPCEPHDTLTHIRSEPHDRNTPSQYSLNITANALDKNDLHSLNNKDKSTFNELNDKNYKRNTIKFDEEILETEM